MVKVVGIRFRNAGKIYYFGPGKLQLKAGMHAIVETARGVEMGTVMTDPREVSEESVVQLVFCNLFQTDLKRLFFLLAVLLCLLFILLSRNADDRF